MMGYWKMKISRHGYRFCALDDKWRGPGKTYPFGKPMWGSRFGREADT